MYEFLVWMLLGVLTVYFAVRFVSKCWVPADGYYDSNASPMFMSVGATRRPLILIMLTDWFAYMAIHEHRLYQGTKDDLVMGLFALLMPCWTFYLLWLFEPSDTNDRRAKANTPRVGYLYSFWRKKFFTDYQPSKYAPFGRLVKLLGLSHFQSGLSIYNFEKPGHSGQRVKATLVAKMTPTTDPKKFGQMWWEAYTVFDALCEDVAQREGDQTHALLKFAREEQDVVIEVQKVMYYPPAITTIAVQPAS